MSFLTIKEPLQLPAYQKLLKIWVRNTNIYRCELMFLFGVMRVQLISGIDMFLHSYPPSTHQSIWHNERHRDIGTNFKNSVYRNVMLGKCTICIKIGEGNHFLVSSHWRSSEGTKRYLMFTKYNRHFANPFG